MDLSELYHQMARVRAFEEAVEAIWRDGRISGEMHLGTGEEAVAAGVIAHFKDGDGLALTHRCSPPLVVRGVSLVAILRELLGMPDGLCKGNGGHMHLFSKEHMAGSSGIVGASLPLGAGFALANKRLRKGSVSVAFTGDGAFNQGMALETLNLAIAWQLPLVVVCIDNSWAIATRTHDVSGGDVAERAQAFGWVAEAVDGRDVEAVYEVAGRLMSACRKGKGPQLLVARAPRLDGHFLGDPLISQAKALIGSETKRTVSRVMSSAVATSGGGLLARTGSLVSVMAAMARARREPARGDRRDPMVVARRTLKKRGISFQEIDMKAAQEVKSAVEAALGKGGDRG